MGIVAEAAGIEGVVVRPLREIPTDGGAVLHMLRADSPLYAGFGEVYFSEVLPGVVRAWKRHRAQTQHLAVPVGLLRLALYDARDDSPTSGALAEQVVGRPGRYALLRIPPGVWYGFAAIGGKSALIANCTDIPHSPEDVDRLPWDSPAIPYHWSI